MDFNYKCGDKVVCVNDSDIMYGSLILYNVYVILTIRRLAYDITLLRVLTEDGFKVHFESKRFEPIDIHRTNIINKILDE